MNPHAHRSAYPPALIHTAWRHRVLIGQLTRREISARYKGSSLGVLWSFAQPVLMLAVYTFVFGTIFQGTWPGGSGSKAEFALVLFAGLLVFNLFADCIGPSPSLILAHANYVKKVVFPIEVLPLAKLGASAFHLATSTLVWLVFHAILLGAPPPTAVLFPLVVLPLGALTLGASYFLAALGVYIRDVAQFIGVVLSVLMFLSPIFYSAASVPEPYRGAMAWSPLTFAVEASREVLLWGRIPDIGMFGAHAFGAIVAAGLGFAWFQKTRHGFADVL